MPAPRGRPARPCLQASLLPPVTDFRCLLTKYLYRPFCRCFAPLSAAMSALGLARLEPPDKLHGRQFNLLDDAQFRDLCSLAVSGIVGAASAAPPYSRARLRPGGPRPVEHPTSIPPPLPAQQRELYESSLLHSGARHFLALVAAHGGLIILENPASSILWLDPSVWAWLSLHVAACQSGLPKA